MLNIIDLLDKSIRTFIKNSNTFNIILKDFTDKPTTILTFVSNSYPTFQLLLTNEEAKSVKNTLLSRIEIDNEHYKNVSEVGFVDSSLIVLYEVG